MFAFYVMNTSVLAFLAFARQLIFPTYMILLGCHICKTLVSDFARYWIYETAVWSNLNLCYTLKHTEECLGAAGLLMFVYLGFHLLFLWSVINISLPVVTVCRSRRSCWPREKCPRCRASWRNIRAPSVSCKRRNSAYRARWVTRSPWQQEVSRWLYSFSFPFYYKARAQWKTWQKELSKKWKIFP